MNLNRTCPFCGHDEQELKVLGASNPQGVPAIVKCTACDAGTEPKYCEPGNYNDAIVEWREGVIYSTYMSRIKF
jgi:hypothetical protein